MLEDPYGYAMGNIADPGEEFVQPPFGPYAFLEIPEANHSDAAVPGVERFFRGKSNGKTFGYAKHVVEDGFNSYRGVYVPYIVERQRVEKTHALYGFTWRGISRSSDRALGIAGGELVVLDMKTNEVIGVRRNFSRSGNIKNGSGIWWETSQSCPQLTKQEGHRHVKRNNVDFVKSVLKSAVNIN